MIDTLTVPIQHASLDEYLAAGAAVPVEGNYTRMRPMLNASLGPKNPGYALYTQVLDPYLWPAIISSSAEGIATSYWAAILRQEQNMIYPPMTPGRYLHLMYPGSRYSYACTVAGSTTAPTLGSVVRVDLEARTTSAPGVISKLFINVGYNAYYHGLGGSNFWDIFIDDISDRVCFGSHYIALFYMYQPPHTEYHQAWINWGGYTSGQDPTPPSAETYDSADPHVAWLLGAPSEERASAYKYLYGDASGTIYSYIDGVQIGVLGGLTADSFRSYGMDAPPPGELLMALDGPHMYRWTDLLPSVLPLTAEVIAIPTQNSIECAVDLTDAVTIISITATYTGTVTISHSFDGGASWTAPVPMADFLAASHLDLLRGPSRVVRFKIALESADASVSSFRVRYGKEEV